MRLTIVAFFILISTLRTLGQFSKDVDQLVKMLNRLDRPTKAIVDSLNASASDYSRAYPLLMMEFSERAISFAEEIEYPEGKAQAYLNLSSIYRTKGDVTKGIESGIQAYSQYDQLQDSINMARSFNAIASCYKDLGQQDSSLNFLRKALMFNQSDLKTRGMSLNNIGSTFIDMDELDSAEKYYKAALEIREEIRDLEGLGVTYGNLGIIAIEKENNPELANYWYDRSIEMKIDSRDFFNLAFTYINKGNLRRNLGEYDLARVNYQTAVDIADSINAHGIKASVYSRWSTSERLAGNMEKASELGRLSDKIYIEVLEERQASELSQLRATYELAQQQQQVIIQEQDIALLKRKRSLLILQFALALGAALMLFGLYWMQRSKGRREKELQEAKESQLNGELQHKNSELSLFTINFIQKQQMMHELNQLIAQANKEKKAENLRKKIKEVSRLISNQQRNDKEWEDFRVYFEKVHQDFFRRLQADFSDLTITEMRLGALIKMNLNIKETASILGIEPDSVKTARSRLRAKLGLSREQNLANFLSSY